MLLRGSLNAIESDIVGANTGDRILSPTGLLLWPSDHAGIVARLSFSHGNAVIIANANISGFTINDTNGNGKWDAGETGIQDGISLLRMPQRAR